MAAAKPLTREEINVLFPVKVELHVHLEGAVRFATILELGRQRGLKLPAETVSELKDKVCVLKTEDLTTALENFFIFGPAFAGYHEGVYRITYEFCEDAARNGTRYSELRYSPHFLSDSQSIQTYAARTGGTYTPRDVVRSVNQAIKDATARFDVIVRTILCCIRHIPEWSMEVVNLCSEFVNEGVVAMDIAGPEIGKIVTDTDQSLHLAAFQEAKKRGIRCIAHAGEVGTHQSVQLAVDGYGAQRLGHGYRCEESEELYQRVVKDGVHFEICPISSIATGGAPNGKTDHPILRLVKDGASFSINTDDPTLFDNTLADDYLCAMEMGLSKNHIIAAIFHAARASFASQDEKGRLLAELQSVYGDGF